MIKDSVLEELEFEENIWDSSSHPLAIGDTNQALKAYAQGKLPVYVGKREIFVNKPIIGITMSLVKEKFVARKRYADEVIKAGGRPVFIPHIQTNAVPDYLQEIDGLVLSGGGDLHPDNWGAKLTEAGERKQIIDRVRDEFELELVKLAIDNQVPLLGICRGMQIINVARGGTLLQSLPSQRTHMPDSNDYVGMVKNFHRVLWSAKTQMAQMASESLNQINSGHHMAIYELGQGLIIGAIAYDRTVEAIEGSNNQNFLIGVQWHPEAMIDNQITQGLFGGLVKTANGK